MNNLPKIDLRECNETDIDIVADLARSTYFESFAAMNTPENMEKYLQKAFNRQQVEIEILNPNSKFYLLLYNLKSAGYLKVNENEAQTDLQEETGLELERIYVKTDFQGLGLGRRLIDKGIEIARNKDKKYIWLGVWEKNANAIQFYEELGFQKFATHPFWMGSEQQTDYLMRKEI